jgi:hypothetical protein
LFRTLTRSVLFAKPLQIAVFTHWSVVVAQINLAPPECSIDGCDSFEKPVSVLIFRIVPAVQTIVKVNYGENLYCLSNSTTSSLNVGSDTHFEVVSRAQ